MSMTSEQIHYLRSLAADPSPEAFYEVFDALNEAADTIEALSAKLEKANTERLEALEKNELIKEIWRIFDAKYNDAVRFDESETELAKRIMIDVQNVIENHTDYGGWWIPCKNRLPKEKGWYLVYAKYQRPFVAYFKGKTFPLNNHYHEIIAWQPLPEPYTENEKQVE